MFINGNKVYKDAECQHLAGYLFYAHYAGNDGDWLSYDREGNHPVPPEAITEEMFMTGIYVKNSLAGGDEQTGIYRAISYMHVENRLVGSDDIYTGPIMLFGIPAFSTDTTMSVAKVYYYSANCCSKHWPKNNG